MRFIFSFSLKTLFDFEFSFLLCRKIMFLYFDTLLLVCFAFRVQWTLPWFLGFSFFFNFFDVLVVVINLDLYSRGYEFLFQRESYYTCVDAMKRVFFLFVCLNLSNAHFDKISQFVTIWEGWLKGIIISCLIKMYFESWVEQKRRKADLHIYFATSWVFDMEFWFTIIMF